jgi:hypothetical protein
MRAEISAEDRRTVASVSRSLLIEIFPGLLGQLGPEHLAIVGEDAVKNKRIINFKVI